MKKKLRKKMMIFFMALLVAAALSIVCSAETVPLATQRTVRTICNKTVMKKAATKTRTKTTTKTSSKKRSYKSKGYRYDEKITTTTTTRVKYTKGKRTKITYKIIRKVTKRSKTKIPVLVTRIHKNKTVTEDRIDARLTQAFQKLGFRIVINPRVSYAGYFSARDREIILRDYPYTDVLYHEYGHFLDYISGLSSTDRNMIYEAEVAVMQKYVERTCYNASEYFAEAFVQYTREPAVLKKERPKTYAVIRDSLNRITDKSIAWYKKLYEFLDKNREL